MKHILTRYYYILTLIIGLPLSILKRKKLVFLIRSDWRLNTRYYIKYGEKAFNDIKKSAFKTPFYTKLLRDGSLNYNSKLEEFPVISKQLIKDSNKGFYSKNIFLPKTITNTGGSTGNPFEFFISPQNRDLEFSHQLFFFERFGYIKKDLIYSFDGTRIKDKEIEGLKFWKENKFKNFPYGSVHFSVLTLNHQTVNIYINKLLNDKPSFLRGYPSAISFLASEIIASDSKLKFNFLKGILLTSETISHNQISLISEAFNCPVLPQYGMTEVCAFAFTEKNSLQYYCSPYYGITEVLDIDNKQVNVGETGELVLTSLGNHFQPFIRYKTGDLAVYGGTHNGFVILDKILGRSQDYLIDCNNEKVMLVGLVFGAHLKAFKAMKAWQIIQKKSGLVEIMIDILDNWEKDFEREVIETIGFNGRIKISIIYGANFILTKSGKRLFVIQSLS